MEAFHAEQTGSTVERDTVALATSDHDPLTEPEPQPRAVRRRFRRRPVSA